MDNAERTTYPALSTLLGDDDDDTDLLTFIMGRLLVSPSSESPPSAKQNRNTIIYIIYLTVLGMCCLSPCFYYVRFWSWQRRRLRRMRELERAGVAVAMARSSGTAVNDDADAVQEERKARITQLMKPVRITLDESHIRKGILPDLDGEEEQQLCLEQHSMVVIDGGRGGSTIAGCENGNPSSSQKKLTAKVAISSRDEANSGGPNGCDDEADDDEDDESRIVEVPLPGLKIFAGDATADTPLATCRTGTIRRVPAFCAVCLSSYRTGNTIVWSSNWECAHVFHEECIQQWLFKLPQRDGPICPCCRRDFLIDPYDLILAGVKGDDAEESDALVSETHHASTRKKRNYNHEEEGVVLVATDLEAGHGVNEALDTINLDENSTNDI